MDLCANFRRFTLPEKHYQRKLRGCYQIQRRHCHFNSLKSLYSDVSIRCEMPVRQMKVTYRNFTDSPQKLITNDSVP